MSRTASVLLVVVFASAGAIAQELRLPPRAPPDSPPAVTPDQRRALDEAIKPYAEEAQKTFPGARARFVAGLPKGQSLFVVTRLYDECGRFEQVFLSVAAIRDGIVEGRIWSNPNVATNYRFRDRYAFPEDRLMDWLIAHPDGTEEGNVLGRFMSSGANAARRQ